MIPHSQLTNTEVRLLIRAGVITFGGNKKLNIYELLYCKSRQKYAKTKPRVLFKRI